MKKPPRTPQFEKTEVFKQLKAEMEAAGKAELDSLLASMAKKQFPPLKLVVNNGRSYAKRAKRIMPKM